MQQLADAAGADRRAADHRRGLRAHGLRRRAACQRGVDRRRWRRAASSSPASARPTTSPAGRSATCSRRRALMAEFRKVHQFNVFTVNTPMQHGLARHMADADALPGAAGASTSASATCSAQGLADTRCACCPAQGSYFQCVDYSGRQRSRRGRLLRLADARDRRGGDSAVGLLRRWLRAAHRAPVLCQTRRDAAARARAPGASCRPRASGSVRALQRSGDRRQEAEVLSAPASRSGPGPPAAVARSSKRISSSPDKTRHLAGMAQRLRRLARHASGSSTSTGWRRRLGLATAGRAPPHTAPARRGRPAARTARRWSCGTAAFPARPSHPSAVLHACCSRAVTSS